MCVCRCATVPHTPKTYAMACTSTRNTNRAKVMDSSGQNGPPVHVQLSTQATEAIVGVSVLEWFKTMPLEDAVMQSRLDDVVAGQGVYDCAVWFRKRGGLLIKHARCIGSNAPTTPSQKKRKIENNMIPATTNPKPRFAFESD
jgi:hypothetical protein